MLGAPTKALSQLIDHKRNIIIVVKLLDVVSPHTPLVSSKQ